MRFPWLFASLFLFCVQAAEETPPVRATGTTSEERAAFSQALQRRLESALAKPITAKTSDEWRQAFWCMAFMRQRTAEVRAGLGRAFASAKEMDALFQRHLVETAYGLFPVEFSQEVEALAGATDDAKLHAACVYYLLRAARDPRSAAERWLADLAARFPAWADDPTLVCLEADLRVSPRRQLAKRPSMDDLLAAPFLPGKVVIFSFQRLSRDWPGLAVVRGEDGKFLRDAEGEFLAVPQLARSQSGLPGILSNGDTPQGVFSWRGFATSDNQHIGPTPNLQLRLPMEVAVEDFHHGLVSGEDAAAYASLLPPKWRAYGPIWRAFHAGKAGRFDIIAHGTTIDPQWSAGLPFHPNTPSLGCLTCSELWSPEDGARLHSDQDKLVTALQRAGWDHGYLVVVEWDDRQEPVLLKHIRGALRSAERGSTKRFRLFGPRS